MVIPGNACRTKLGRRLADWQRNDAHNPLLHGSLTLLQGLLMAGAVWTYHRGWYAALVVVWLVAVIVAHNKLIAFHEAAHGNMQPVRFLNELIGQLIGCASLVPLTAYRIVHARHHAYLGTERDIEFWPFVDPSVPRWRRVLAVTAELLCGYFHGPYVFLRGVLVTRSAPAAQRRRVLIEYLACGLFWVGLLTVITWYGWWPEFCVAFFLPGYAAAVINSWRRMIEHLGMLGDTVETRTRTIVPEGWIGKVVSAGFLHVDYHGTHHRYGRIPYYRLPEATRGIYGEEPEELVVFPGYWSALRDLLPHLANPRIGDQWRGTAEQGGHQGRADVLHRPSPQPAGRSLPTERGLNP